MQFAKCSVRYFINLQGGRRRRLGKDHQTPLNSALEQELLGRSGLAVAPAGMWAATHSNPQEHFTESSYVRHLFIIRESYRKAHAQQGGALL